MAVALPLLLAILSCRLGAAVDATRAYSVELACEIAPSAEAARLPVSILLARGATIANLTANGEPIELDASQADVLRGEVMLPAQSESLHFRYDVSGPTIPLVVPDLPQAESRPDTFTARLSLPPGTHLVESFPTGFETESDGLVLALPVLPAFVSLTVSDEPPLVSLPSLLDALVLLFLVTAGALAWRYR